MLLTAALCAHPSTPNCTVRRLGAEVRLPEPGILAFHYVLDADMTRIRIPARSSTAARIDSLWEHTCFEAFVATKSASSYHEFNFSPSLDWAIYRFSDYRKGISTPEVERVPQISVHQSDDRLGLTATVSLETLGETHDVQNLRFALAAVIEDETGGLSYWALGHRTGMPDFHVHADSNTQLLGSDFLAMGEKG
jgi:hypothetical protein